MTSDPHTAAGAGGTIAGWIIALADWSLSASEILLLVLVTIPTGILAWWKVYDTIVRRRARKNEP